MRLAARVKSGFYPAPVEAVRSMCGYISSCDPEATLIDPCAGEGDAVSCVAEELCIPHDRIYACELECGRATALKERLPGAHIIGPVDSLSADISREVFSVAWVNPPYDTEEGGGGRVEMRFAEQYATRLVPHGLMMLSTVQSNIDNTEFMNLISLFLYDVQVFTWPGERRFNEVTLFGLRRESRLAKPPRNLGLAYEPTKYVIPAGRTPNLFAARGYTNQQICELLSTSPLMEPPIKSLRDLDPVAPMDAKAGHMALLLSGGYLDGVVCLPGGEPHVVAGRARKVRSLVSETEELLEDGGCKRVKTIAERIQITVRTVDQRGKYTELSSDPGQVVEED